MSQHDKDETLQGIAIIGLSGRFPGASNVTQFWQNLVEEVESIQSFTDEELSESTVDKNHPAFVGRGAVLENADQFDAGFFDFLPSEAEITDPQQRLFLECAWEAMEDAGYDSKRTEGRVGVYGGVGRNQYVNRLYSNPDLIETVGKYPAAIGNDSDFLATRVAYKMNLNGPAVTVQTACSTSLVAVHMACRSLLTYECDMALAGGSAIKTPQKEGYVHQEGGIFSKDGHCRAFDVESSGTVLGNGVGIVVLKRLEDAVLDGDHVYAVIKGSAINNDGSAKVGFTAPSVDRQADVIADAMAFADIDPETISYVEAHGTATKVGDPIEIAALTQAYRLSTEKTGYCAIGSVKTNIGHLDNAAGVTGLMKTALMLKNKQIPASLHFTAPNPALDLEQSPFYVNTKTTAWEANGPRRAAVSSFGMGGTNAHAVLEEAPFVDGVDGQGGSAATIRPQYMIPLAAKTQSALEQMSLNLADYLEANPNVSLADAAYTLQVGRREWNNRRVVVAEDRQALIAALRGEEPKRVEDRLTKEEERSVVFLFSGQGSQYVRMGEELYRTEPTFRDTLNKVAELLKPHVGEDIRDLIYPAVGQEEAAREKLAQTMYTQPVLFAFEYALATLWMEWGVQPRAMVGHSIGEYVAACLAGVFTLEDALKLVAARGRLMQEMPRGAMLAVQKSEAEANEYLGGTLSVAGINAPNSTVLAGPIDEIDALEARLREEGVAVSRLQTSHAFHSSMMDPVLERFEALVRGLDLNAPELSYFSNVSGTWITAEEATDPSYWSRHLRQAVRFGDNVREALDLPNCLLLEVGPGRTLSSMARFIMRETEKEATVLTSVRHPEETLSDSGFLLKTLGGLWLNGVTIDYVGFYSHETRRRLSLPTYPFERKSYFLKPGTFAVASKGRGRQADAADWFAVPVWKQTPPTFMEKENLSGERWLVFGDEERLGERVSARLQEQGAEIVRVEIGATFAQMENGVYSIDPANREDYVALIKELQESEQLPTHIAHLFSVTTKERTLDDSQNFGLYSLLYLAQAMSGIPNQNTTKINILTNMLQTVAGEASHSPERATLIGAAKVLPIELETFDCRIIDVELPQGTRQAARELDLLTAELVSDASDFLVAFRRGQRYVQTHDKARLPQAKKAVLRDGGVYLITGVSHLLGLQLAEHVASVQDAKLVLLTSPNFPAQSEWTNLLAPGATDEETATRIRRLQALAERADVYLTSCDLGDADQVNAVIGEATARFGELNGVLHAEETVGQGLAQLKTHEGVEAVLRPKLKGTLVLEAACRDMELDVFAVFSRMLGVTGGFGQSDNAATCSFLDAWASARQAAGLPVVVLDFGMWQFDALPEGPMMPAELKAEFGRLQSRYGLSFAEGFEAFERLLDSGLTQAVISTQDLQAVIEDLSQITPSVFMKTLQAGRSGVDGNREYVAPTNDVERQIAEFWTELFGVEQVSLHDNFFELGGNSLLGVQLVNRVRNTFDVDLPMSALFEAGTVADLAAYITNSQLTEEEMDEIERMLREIEGLSEEEILNGGGN